MQGLAAISASNGWAMAIAGACIVISGLAVLSFIISQLHRLIAIFEKKEKDATEEAPQTTTVSATKTSNAVPSDLLSDIEAAARIYKPLTAELGESFELTQLYQLLQSAKHPHPIITVRELRCAGYLIPTGEGMFSWKNI